VSYGERCYHLVYDCQRASASDRALGRAQAIRVRLGGTPSMFEPFPCKPKGMHWSTYKRLRLDEKMASDYSWSPSVLRVLAAQCRRGLGDGPGQRQSGEIT
jgi:hypothetical protein